MAPAMPPAPGGFPAVADVPEPPSGVVSWPMPPDPEPGCSGGGVWYSSKISPEQAMSEKSAISEAVCAFVQRFPEMRRR